MSSRPPWEPAGHPHEKLEVYRLAMQFAKRAAGLAQALPKHRAELADQLDRASLSIVLNIAEGAGEYRPREKARFFRMAGRSATECAAALEYAGEVGALATTDCDEARALLSRIGAMLTALAKKHGR